MGRFFNVAANNLSSCRTETPARIASSSISRGSFNMFFHQRDAGEYARIPRAITLRRRNTHLIWLLGEPGMNQQIGNGHGNFMPQPLPDPFQHHVDGGGTAGASHAVPVNFKKRLCGLHPRKAFAKPGRVSQWHVAR